MMPPANEVGHIHAQIDFVLDLVLLAIALSFVCIFVGAIALAFHTRKRRAHVEIKTD